MKLPARALLSSLLVVAGCDRLCHFGIGGKDCAPCQASEVPSTWHQDHLAPLVPGEEAVVCEAHADEMGKAKLVYWVSGKVHDANLSVAEAAQDNGWSRTGDNWYASSADFESPKWSEFALPRGDVMRSDVRAEAGGARVELSVEGFPEPPELRGNVTLLAYKAATFALFDGSLAVLPGVKGRAVASFDDGFYFWKSQSQLARYEADGKTTPLDPFPMEGEGFLSPLGLGPSGMPWMAFNPHAEGKPAVLGELVDGAWVLETIADLDPPLPNATMDGVHTPGGQVWLRAGNVLYARDADGWHGFEVPAKLSAREVLVAESDSVLVSTEKAILRAKVEEGAITTSVATKMRYYPELYPAGELGVVARNDRKVVAIGGDAVTDLGLPGESKAERIATSSSGAVAVATKSPSTITVRALDGTVTRYPAEGELPARVVSMKFDARGRVWALLVESDPVVLEGGTVTPIPGLVAEGTMPYSVTFMGEGAEPRLDSK